MSKLQADSGSKLSSPDLLKLKYYLINTLSRELESENVPVDKREEFASKRLNDIYERANLRLPQDIRSHIFKEVNDELFGFGPIQGLLNDPEVTEVMVNGPKNIYVERKGVLTKASVIFEDDDHVMRIIERIIAPLGRYINADSPTVDARLPDGSRVNAVVRPVAIDGPSITIRKFSKEKLKMRDLIQFDSITESMAEFLRACVLARLNVVISGGTGSGKTTLLNIMSALFRATNALSPLKMPPNSGCNKIMLCGSKPNPQTWKDTAKSASATWCATPCVCAPTASSSAKSVAAKPSICFRQ
jgi:pilus assembly protein CpaF